MLPFGTTDPVCSTIGDDGISIVVVVVGNISDCSEAGVGANSSSSVSGRI